MRKAYLYIIVIMALLVPTRLWAVELTPYFTLFPLGLVKIPTLDLKDASTGTVAGEADTNVGFGFFGAVGLMFDKKFGVELEAGFVEADISSLEKSAIRGTEGDTFNMTVGMVNVFYRSPGTLHSSDIYTMSRQRIG